jgi:hypothetical protein
MNLLSISTLLVSAALFPSSSVIASVQKKKVETVAPPSVVRTISRHETRRLGYGGTFTIVGAPSGSITIEGWARNEVDISAEIELRANSEADLEVLSRFNNFVVDLDADHLQVLTHGTHDPAFMRPAKKFPKALLGLPWKIDYRIRVPFAADMEVNAGKGPVRIADVEGNIRLSVAEGVADLKLSGGTLSATLIQGKLNLEVPGRSWARGSAELRVASGDIAVMIPPGFSGDFEAEVLRAGQITNSYAGLEPRDNTTPNQVKASLRAGSGGASFNLTVGDGTIVIKKQTVNTKQ